MLRIILRSVAAVVLLFTVFFVSSTPFVTVAFGQDEPVDSCCYPSDNHDEPSQPCDTAAGCSCLFCLHIDLHQAVWTCYRPQPSGGPVFTLQFPVRPDFPQTIDYPPEQS